MTYQPRQRRANPFDSGDFPPAERITPQRPSQGLRMPQPEYIFDEDPDDFQFHLAPADPVTSPQQTHYRSSPREEKHPMVAQPVVDESVFTGKATYGHNIGRIVMESTSVAGISAFGIGMLSWVVDKFALKFVSENYSMAPTSLHITSGILAFFAVMLFAFLYLFLDRVSGIAKGIYTGLIWVIILSGVAYVTLTSLTVYAVVYLILIIGVAIPLSYIPNIVTSNRYATA